MFSFEVYDTVTVYSCLIVFNGSNTDGSFTMALSNYFLSPLEENHIVADLG